jgi:methionyl-tRNA formyltransferase
MKCLLFALTGFGNSVLSGLLKSNRFDNIIVFSRRETGEFPYYKCEPIQDLCKREDIECLTDVDLKSSKLVDELRDSCSFIIISATFHKIIPESLIKLACFGAVNIHPSLLPFYRGATPTNWAIINGEKETGITYHKLSKELDMGDILMQERLDIANMNDGELRYQLALLTERTIDKFLGLYLNGSLEHIKQKNNSGSYYPRVFSENGLEMIPTGNYFTENIIRGLTPYPGVEVTKLIKGKKNVL